jgi:hypothetical protein
MPGEAPPARFDWIEWGIGSAIRIRTVPVERPITVPGGALLQRAATAVNITMAFRLLDGLRDARRLLEGSAAPQLVVEALLIEMRAALGPAGVK